jgi:hypothetical protein
MQHVPSKPIYHTTWWHIWEHYNLVFLLRCVCSVRIYLILLFHMRPQMCFEFQTSSANGVHEIPDMTLNALHPAYPWGQCRLALGAEWTWHQCCITRASLEVKRVKQLAYESAKRERQRWERTEHDIHTCIYIIIYSILGLLLPLDSSWVIPSAEQSL